MAATRSGTADFDCRGGLTITIALVSERLLAWIRPSPAGSLAEFSPRSGHMG